LLNECARLIANAVVHYNNVILSDVLQTLQNASSNAAPQALKRISPLAWRHLNFYGGLGENNQRVIGHDSSKAHTMGGAFQANV
jgi:DNA polymerase III psi subunit